MPLRNYLANNAYVPLSREEEVALNRRRQKGDNEARSELITRNLRLAFTHARKFLIRGFELDDLVSQAILGLTVAVDGFEHHKGKLSVHAGFQIKAHLIAFVSANRHIISAPSGASRIGIEYSRRLRDRGSVDVADFAHEFHTRVPRLLSIIALSAQPESLDAPLADDENPGFTLREVVPSDEPPPCGITQDADAKEWVRRALAGLSPREREVINRRFGLIDDRESSLQEIAQAFGITRERVRQIEAKALRRLREQRQRALRELAAA